MIRIVAVALALGMAGLVCLPIPVLSIPMLGASILLLGYAMLRAAAPGFLRLGRDPYDLRALRELHEQAEEEVPFEEDDVEIGGSVACLTCNQAYDARLGHCPRCGRSQFGG